MRQAVRLAPLLKICGLRDPDQAAAVAAMGIDAVGVVAVSSSPRYLAAPRRGPLFAAARRGDADCLGVLVVADPGEEDLEELVAAGGHQVVQLHGNESVERCAELRRRLDVQLWKALRIRRPADLERALAYEGVVDALLLDAWVPDRLGGSGHRLPMEWLEGFNPHLPWWLAGGINADCAAEVLSRLRPDGLDCSSGVERSPGDKDIDKVAALLAAVRPCGGEGEGGRGVRAGIPAA